MKSVSSYLASFMKLKLTLFNSKTSSTVLFSESGPLYDAWCSAIMKVLMKEFCYFRLYLLI